MSYEYYPQRDRPSYNGTPPRPTGTGPQSNSLVGWGIVSMFCCQIGSLIVLLLALSRRKDELIRNGKVSSSTNTAVILGSIGTAILAMGALGSSANSSSSILKELSPLLLIFVVFALLVTMLRNTVGWAGTLFTWFVHLFNKDAVAAAPKPKKSANLSSEINSELSKMRSAQAKHRSLSAQNSLATQLETLMNNTQELFNRLERNKLKQQQKIAAIEYRTHLSRLNELVGDNYYLDLIAHPDYWTAPPASQRIQQVRDAVTAANTLIIQNIQQVNASRDLDFTSALQGLLDSIDNPNPEDMLK